MNSKRVHLLLLAILGASFIALIGGAYLASNLLTQQSAKLTALKAKNQALSQEQLTLAKAKKEIKDYADLEKITRAVVPEDKNQAEAVREIVNIADANNVKLGAITFPASTLGSSKVGALPGATVAPLANASSASTALSQLQPVKSIPGVYQLVISVQSDSSQSVPYSKFSNFLSDLEHNRRTAQVSNISITPDSQNRNNLTFTLSLNEYIKP